MKNELKWLGTAGKRSEAVRNHSKLPVKKLKPMILIHFYRFSVKSVGIASYYPASKYS
jgi:hypothetical protein